MKVKLVANWQLDDCPNMDLELPCLPPVGSLINLDCEDEVSEDSEVKKSCKDFVDSVEVITGSGSTLFMVDDTMFVAYCQVPTIYLVQQ